jgi:hypothetical protein
MQVGGGGAFVWCIAWCSGGGKGGAVLEGERSRIASEVWQRKVSEASPRCRCVCVDWKGGGLGVEGREGSWGARVRVEGRRELTTMLVGGGWGGGGAQRKRGGAPRVHESQP